MNNKNNSRKIKVLHLSSKINKKQNSNYSTKKKLIESYNTKSDKKIGYYINKKINLETSITSEKNNNLSLFSFWSSNTNQEEKLTNKSVRTTRETESNHINNKRNIIKSKSKNQKKVYNNNIKKNININKELDNFKTRIENLFKIITNFENNFIKSEHPKMIKQELDKIINKKYFNKSNLELKKCSKSIKNINIKIAIDKENNHLHKKRSVFNSVNNINTKINKKNLTKNKLMDKNNMLNTYNRRMKYGLLLNENSNKKIKTQRVIENKYNKTNKNNKNNKNIFTSHCYYCPSKSIDISENIIMNNNNQKNKQKVQENQKKIKNKNIYLNSNFNKTPKIRKVEGKIK